MPKKPVSDLVETETYINWEDTSDDKDDNNFVGFGGDEKAMEDEINREHKKRMEKYEETGEWDEN